MASDDRKRNPVFLNQLCQDTIQDIVNKAHEIFQTLKTIQLPNGTALAFRNCQERLNKLKEPLETIDKYFTKLRIIYTELQKRPIEIDDINLLVPLLQLKESEELEKEKPSKSMKEQMLETKKKDLEAQLRIKNEQVEKVMLALRKIIWDMNAVASCMGVVKKPM